MRTLRQNKDFLNEMVTIFYGGKIFFPIASLILKINDLKLYSIIYPLYPDGFYHTDKYNKDGIVHYIF